MTANAKPMRRVRRPHAPLPADFADPAAQDRLIGKDVAASALGIGQSTLLKHVAAGRIAPPLKVGKLSRWPVSYIRKLAASGIAA